MPVTLLGFILVGVGAAYTVRVFFSEGVRLKTFEYNCNSCNNYNGLHRSISRASDPWFFGPIDQSSDCFRFYNISIAAGRCQLRFLYQIT